ncbi:MAG: YbaB/EbfC family nucleoid-associated protein [Planctomycetes bacterium]|nr:YbaB/EbfC family nucleoid-associated protein [Planctomycetota bacterium]
MSGGFGDMGNLLKQAQEMQRQMDRVREELTRATLTGTGGGGVVQARVNGDGEVLAVEIGADVIDSGDKALVEDLVLAALRDALGQAARLRKERLSAVTGGLNLPGIF